MSLPITVHLSWTRFTVRTVYTGVWPERQLMESSHLYRLPVLPLKLSCAWKPCGINTPLAVSLKYGAPPSSNTVVVLDMVAGRISLPDGSRLTKHTDATLLLRAFFVGVSAALPLTESARGFGVFAPSRTLCASLLTSTPSCCKNAWLISRNSSTRLCHAKVAWRFSSLSCSSKPSSSPSLVGTCGGVGSLFAGFDCVFEPFFAALLFDFVACDDPEVRLEVFFDDLAPPFILLLLLAVGFVNSSRSAFSSSNAAGMVNNKPSDDLISCMRLSAFCSRRASSATCAVLSHMSSAMNCCSSSYFCLYVIDFLHLIESSSGYKWVAMTVSLKNESHRRGASQNQLTICKCTCTSVHASSATTFA
eukprot:m.14100 g.14100  ORF g.14100 m.14100 type:complete len:362 (+) comp6142_c0_seq2:740-1825(+)